MDFLFSFIELIAFLGLVLYIGFKRFRAAVWIPAIGIAYALLSFSHNLLAAILPLFFLFYVAAVAFVTLGNLRKHYIINAILYYLKKHMPAISKTEQEALSAGELFWEKGLFQGAPDWEALREMTPSFLSEEENNFIDNQVHSLCNMLNDWDINHRHHGLPPKLWEYVKKERFFSMSIPKEYGGLGFSPYAQSKIIALLASRSYSAAITVMVPNSLGPGELIHRYGTQTQKETYLPKLAKGEEIPCFALTGTTAGSDASSITDSGIICKGTYKGKECLGLRLNWDKRYITLAPVATLVGLAVKVYDPDGLYSEEKNLGITLLLVPANTAGVDIGNHHSPMGQHFMNGPTRGKDVFLPLDAIIGGEEKMGKGWVMLMECLAAGRGISLPAIATGGMKLCSITTGAYARIREQFKMPIGFFEGVEAKLARIGAYTYMADACRRLTLRGVQSGVKPAVASAITKYQLTELGRVVVNDAMDIHGGKGIQIGPNNYMATLYNGIPIVITVEGANILTRSLIIFSQGIVRAHPYLNDEFLLVQEEITPEIIKKFDTLIQSHLGYFIQNFSKSFLYGLTKGRFIKVKGNGLTEHYYRQITYMSAGFAFISDACMMLMGPKIKRMEHMSGRLADILSQLYLASSVLKYYEDRGALLEDYPYVEWCMAECFYNLQIAYDEFFINFPQRGIRRIMKFFLFPYGRLYKHRPLDRSSNKIARSLMEQSEIREFFMRDCYIVPKEDCPIYTVENAFQKVLNLKEIKKKWFKWLSTEKDLEGINQEKLWQLAMEKQVLTAQEIEQWKEAEEALKKAIAVDEFKNKEEV